LGVGHERPDDEPVDGDPDDPRPDDRPIEQLEDESDRCENDGQDATVP
jgi:hypothetical protein